ncbi:MAG: glutamate--tRNA ligase [Rhodospirillales bacterium]
MTLTVRFAPSPTGRLHVGNARMALVNWILARKSGGSAILRFDDTDAERSTEEFAAAIVEDLAWLGLDWDRTERQSARFAAYDAAADRLRGAGRLYPCYETPEELEFARNRQRRMGKPPIYDRSALNLTDEQIKMHEAEGRKPHWRFRLADGEIAFTDLVRGATRFQSENLSDPVLIREDGTYLYMLPSAVDDIDMGVTHVVRGEDHVTNSAIQSQLFAALGAGAPTFAHLPLLTDAEGAGFSKRLGSMSLGDLRDQGCEPMAVNSLLATLGTSDDIEPFADLDALVAAFDIGHFGRAQPRFDTARLWALNARWLHERSYEDVADRLDSMSLSYVDRAFWEAVRANLEKLDDVRQWHDVCFGDVSPVVDDTGFLSEAAALLPDEPWSEATWGDWTTAVKQATGAKGKALFMPLRLALTGLDHGPELKNLLPLIGRERALRRLAGETA